MLSFPENIFLNKVYGFRIDQKYLNPFCRTPLFFDLQKSNVSVSDKSGTVIPFSAIFLLEMNAQVLLKVATKGSFRDKKTLKNLHF